MSEAEIFPYFIRGFVAVAVAVFVLLFFVSAPYGRHARAGWGPKINSTLGWIVMEAPSPIVFAACFYVGDRRDFMSVTALGLWLLHYVNRSFVFPFRRRGAAADMPLSIAVMSFLFNSTNGYVNGRYLFHFAPDPAGAFSDPVVVARFAVGAAIFLVGFAINQQSDTILFQLRKPGETGYKIPYGGFYRFITSPNYFGEIVEWSGFALLTWSPAALAFVIWTAANLVPRARTHHRWYQERFPDYPKERRAIVPFLY